jgi:hypothetical protein
MNQIDNLENFFSRSLIVEFGRVFGIDNTKKLLAVFAGMTIQVPSTEELQEMERDVAVFKILSSAKDRTQRRILRGEVCARFGLAKMEVQEIYRRMDKAWRKYIAAKSEDEATSAHKRRKLSGQ